MCPLCKAHIEAEEARCVESFRVNCPEEYARIKIIFERVAPYLQEAARKMATLQIRAFFGPDIETPKKETE